MVGSCWLQHYHLLLTTYYLLLTTNYYLLDSMTPLEWLAHVGCNISRQDVIAQGEKTPLP